ncbi:hybrid sensor histidine kinase/response regulator [Haliangium ochraceum]|uniref:histidine kinase n=1 Tax=Haliangium ochraceum (strain DSM 14365 / JCM 11303 / SMP-2) TaxID=502025 RepID=D0LM37_HALO1|nr:PAS domain-containing sensor histidine kinase [Haliangium ochraceum]ACY15215.1 PAS/PAC sensor hybrid histidine kinase [Haliangium ochraceum DSM 14365]
MSECEEQSVDEHLSTLVEMMDSVPEAVLAVAASGRVVLGNRAAHRLLGAALTASGPRLLELFQPASPASTAAASDRRSDAEGAADAQPLSALLTRFASGPAQLVAPTSQSASAQRFAVRAVPVHGSSGAVCGAVLSFRAVGVMSWQLHEAGRMLQTVIDNIPQFVFWKDARSVYLGCNRNFARAAGVAQPDDIVGKVDSDLAWRPEEAERFVAVDARVMSTGEPAYRLLEPRRRADGVQSWVETNKLPLRDDAGEVIGILGTFEDVTERRELEEQLRHAQKMKAVGQLAGGIAHDFNNLLTAIACHAELAQQSVESGSPAAFDLEQIMHAIRHAAELTQQILVFSRRRVTQQKLVRVNDAVLGISTMLRPLIRANSEMITLLRAGGQVRMDAGELEQVIVNLVVNGSNAMPEGGKITIETADLDIGTGDETHGVEVSAGAYVSISIEDTGTGMTAEVKERIFEPFFTTKGPGEGTGLGLAIVYGVITRAGGYITVDSEPGRGTRFCILLPRAEVQEDDAPLRPISYTPQPGTETLLLAEDEAAIRHVTERILGELGYTVLSASNGEQALRMATAHGLDKIDLVLTDVVMPVMGGTELVERLRELRPDMRVLFLSGYTGTAGIDRFLSADAAFLQKPFTFDVLTRKVREVLDAPAHPAAAP